jgi:hypothetical protein
MFRPGLWSRSRSHGFGVGVMDSESESWIRSHGFGVAVGVMDSESESEGILGGVGVGVGKNVPTATSL